MVSFFRRKKPDAPSHRRYSAEELAAAFPTAQPVQAPAESEPVQPAVPAEPVAAITPVMPFEQVTPPPTLSPKPAQADVPQPARTRHAEDTPATLAAAAPHAQAARSASPAPLQAGFEQAASRLAPAVPALERFETAEPLASDTALPAATGKAGWRERLRDSGFARSFGGLFARNPKLDDDLLDEIETALLIADVGVGATTVLVDDLRKRMKSREFADARALLAALRGDLIAMLQPVARPLQIDSNAKPFVVLTVGVNGVGKTTTIGKLARRFRDENHSLMLAAGDTFRAAAVAQLQAWGDRNGVPVVAQGQNTSGKGGDAASVAFDALQAAKARGIEVLITDTAGRLHTQHGLMAELGKIKRVIAKVDPAAPHEVLMVIDGTTGQNALSQLRQFHAAVGVTGLVVTKLDGTAKGGVVFALAREFGIPIRFAGIGERPEDLRVFDAEAFVDALLPESLGA